MMFHIGKIINKSLASPTVMLLEIHAPSLPTFLPGQWVDFIVKPYEWVGGFSIASSPRDLPRFTLAVKKSNLPPATWVHQSSQVGTSIEIRVGGDFYLEGNNLNRPSVFCAGGIGISPILSLYREFLYHHRNNHQTNNNSQVETTPKTTFLYSVSAEDELVFADELAKLSKPGCHRMIFTKTNSGTTWDANNVYETSVEFNHVEKKCGRRLTELINDAPVDTIYYICGPPSMIDDAVGQLNRKGVPSDSVKYEKWW